MKNLIPAHLCIRMILFISVILFLQSSKTFSQQFTEDTSISLPAVSYSAVAWGDFDNDGDMDLILTGDDNSKKSISKIYKNNNGSFTELTSVSLPNIDYGSIEWGDYDNDGFLDFLFTGYSGNNKYCRVYKNNGGVTFTTSISLTPIAGGTAAWGDFNNDGYLDIILTGSDVCKVYKNNRNGTFSEQIISPFTGRLNWSHVAWGDYNNDGYPDLLATDVDASDDCKIFKNNGNGTFTEQTNISIVKISFGIMAWGDYDNDGYLDFVVAGNDSNMNPLTKLYRNNGDGTFSIQNNIIFPYVECGSVAWGDYDNDGNLDIIVTGYGLQNRVCRVYRNNGNGTFSYQSSIAIAALYYGTVSWVDYDSDGDLDIMITGYGNTMSFTKFYKNNGNVFNTMPNPPANLASTVYRDRVALNWDKAADKETPQKGLNYNIAIGTAPNAINSLSPMSDRTTGFRRIIKAGNFQGDSCTLKDFSPGTYYWSVQAIDGSFAGSKFAEEKSFTILPSTLAITSPNGLENWVKDTRHNITWTSSNLTTVKLEYTTDNGKNWSTIASNIPASSGSYNWTIPNTPSNQCKIRISDVEYPNIVDTSDSPFTIIRYFGLVPVALPGVCFSSVAWGDYDNDGVLEILITGSGISKLLKKNQTGLYTEQTSSYLRGVSDGSAAWGDYNNDGYLDILQTGSRTSQVYKNNGNGTFTEQDSIWLTGVVRSSAAWGDYNNDGYLDILLTGYDELYQPFSAIYKNNKAGSFIEQTSISLPGVGYSSAVWGDYDNDGDLDILLTGYAKNDIISKIYKNNGDETFTEQTSVSLPGIYNGSAAWGDYDSDGFLDILLSGYSRNGRISKIYRNNGNGTFSEQTPIPLIPLDDASVSWGDYDNDGDLDILFAGSGISKIYTNSGGGTFTELASLPFTGVYNSSAAWGDFDNDGRLDVLLTGEDNDHNRISVIYKNYNLVANTVPDTPNDLESTVNGNVVNFSWTKAIDKETDQDGLHYNVVIGTTPNGFNILSPMADSLSGYRRVVRQGNSKTNKYYIKDLPSGTYYWSVQAIDAAFAGSKFAPFKSFTIIRPPAAPQLISPANAELNVPVKTKLTWSKLTDAETYRLQLSEDSLFNKTVVNDSSLTSSGKDIENLKTGMKYYWRVNGRNSAGGGSYSPVWNFVTLLPACDSLLAVNQAVKKVKLSWKDRSNIQPGFIIERKAEQDAAYKVIDTIRSNTTSYLDTTVMVSTQYKYRIKAFTQFAASDYSNEAIVATLTSVNTANAIPAEYALMQNYPNPFNPTTIIRYSVIAESRVKLRVYNTIGKEVSVLVDKVQSGGNYEAAFNAGTLSSGIYIYSISIQSIDGKSNYSSIKKMMLLK